MSVKKNQPKHFASKDFWVAALFLIAVFALGGGSRADVLSLVVLRPLAAGFLVAGLLMLTREGWQDVQAVGNLMAASALLVFLHLIPLPYSIWTALPGREVVAQIDSIAGLGKVWRPLTLNPPDGWNALASFLVPAAALLLAACARIETHLRLLIVFVALGVVSVVLGILQLQGDPDGPLYLYRITNQGTLVGLFSNRNHHAMYIAAMLPILAILASRGVSDTRMRGLQIGTCVAIGMLFLAALVVSGSRGGFALGIIGALMAALLFREPTVRNRTHRDSTARNPVRKGKRLTRWRIGSALFLLVLVVGFFTLPSSQTMERVFATDTADESRLEIWSLVPDMAWHYFPAGSGAGTFVEAYKIFERQSDLSFSYVNHAHNDWLEVFLTFGLPGILLLSGAIALWLAGARGLLTRFKQDSPAIQLGRLGAAVTALLAMGSVADYPLRTPSIACLFTFGAVWMGLGYKHSKIVLGKTSQ